MSKEFQTDLEGYKLYAGQEGYRGDYRYGVKVFVKIDREFTEEDKSGSWKLAEDIAEKILKESLRLDPNTAESALKERNEILALFPFRCYVEEIPNGYCSRYCCAFKPWFVVTTPLGRIKIGWRKSVLHLEWTDSAIKRTAAEIFPNEEAWPGYETTQHDKVIHAHGYEAAARYIQKLMQEIS